MDVGRRRKERHVTPPKASPTPRVGRAPRGPIEGRRDREHIRTIVVPDHDDLALRLADRIVEVIARETAAKGRCVLGLATGSTPLGIYRELIRRHQAGEVDFSRVVTFNLDEYYPMPADSPHSYRRYMWENLFAHVNIRPEQVHVPDGGVPRETLAEHCVAYERAIAEADVPALPDARDREERAHRLQRARLVARRADPPGDARHGDPEGCVGGLLRGGQCAAGSDHDGGRHHPRGTGDRADRHRRA